MLEIQGQDFLLDGKKFNIYAGAIHYFRTVPEYWEDRLLKLKLAGFNTVETYVCWNLHEPKQGQFDFSGILDLKKFLQISQKLGLYAIVRPGPYICAEWEFGGLPAWLLKDRSMHLRCAEPAYMECVSRFYHALYKEIGDCQITRGGNVIAMQIENEYGSYGNDKQYLQLVKELMTDCGTEVLMFTSDGPNDTMLSGGTLPNVYKVGNFGSLVGSAFKTLRKVQPDAPLMCGEFWDGWFDRWGAMHHSRPHQTLIPELKAMLKQNGNFNFYMFHGGTNFAFNSGANHNGKYQPTVTSYDYDALLNEWGGYTQKYHAVREVLLAHQGMEKKELPPEPKLQAIGKVVLNQSANFLSSIPTLGEKHTSVAAQPMEQYGQNTGFIHYHHTLKGDYNASKLSLDDLHDRAYVFLNQKQIAVLYRNDKRQTVSLPAIKDGAEIDILVENMGRVNYGPKLYDRKGVEQIRIDNQILFHWDVYTLPLDNLAQLTFGAQTKTTPVFLKGTFKAGKTEDCFVQLKGFKKGYVFVNGFNLGRYWEIGPQQTLYLPGTLLKEENELIVLELEGYENNFVELTDKHLLRKKKFLFF